MRYIPENIWNDFTRKYTNEVVLDIGQGLITTLIILVPQLEIETFKNSPTYDKMMVDYYQLLVKYTDAKVSKPKNIAMSIVSKEDFDIKYKGSWYNFFR